MALRLLAFAAASGRVASVLFVVNELRDWRISEAASQSIDKAVIWVGRQIDDLQPDVVVTEDVNETRHKGDLAKSIIYAVSCLAEDRHLLNPQIKRQHNYANKYEEADVIAALYPELESWRPNWRRFHDNEPRSTVLFEAMAYALYILQDPTKNLGAAMG